MIYPSSDDDLQTIRLRRDYITILKRLYLKKKINRKTFIMLLEDEYVEVTRVNLN